MATRKLNVRQAITEALFQEMRRDPNVIVMGEDVAGGAGRAHLGIIDPWGGPFRSTKGLIIEFGPERVIDTPISEMGFVGAAVGAAMTGLRPVVDLSFIDLLGCCLDQVMNQAAKMRYMMGGQVKVPMVLRAGYGTTTIPGQKRGGGAAAQHSQTMYSMLAHVPGLKCVAPSNPYDAKGLLISAIRDDDPVIFFEHKFLNSLSGDVPEESYTVPIGKAEVVRPGKDLTLVGIGRMTHVCLEAANLLASEGLEAEVIDLKTVSPIDEETILNSVKKTHRLVVVDEDNPVCSVARDVAARVADKGFDYLDAPVKTVNAPHTPVPFSATLEDLYVPQPPQVIEAVHAMLGIGARA